MALDALAADLRAADRGSLVVVTGAGVSVASGIPTFRGDDPGAVWAENLTTLGTEAFFRLHPVASWTFTLDLFQSMHGAEPNPAHRALATLERRQIAGGGTFLLIGQNIDRLHAAAGSRQVIDVHGRFDRVRCVQDGCRHSAPDGSLEWPAEAIDRFRRAPAANTLPRCPTCHEVVRPHLLWFDEFYDGHVDYGWARTRAAAATADLVLFVGTSFAVGVTEMFLAAASEREVPAWSIDPAGVDASRWFVRGVAERAEVALPALIQRLEGPIGQRTDGELDAETSDSRPGEWREAGQ